MDGLLNSTEKTLDVTARQVVLVRNGVGQPRPDVVRINLGHGVLNLGRVAERDDGHVGVEGQVVADELLGGFVDPLPLAVVVHGRGRLQDQDVLLGWVPDHSNLWFQLGQLQML